MMDDGGATLVEALGAIAMLFVIILTLRKCLPGNRRLRGNGNPYYDFDGHDGASVSLPETGRSDGDSQGDGVGRSRG